MKIVDPGYGYSNVEILKMIDSGWVWDNVIPFMAQSLHQHSSMSKARSLPEKCLNDSMTVSKYALFLLMSQMFLGLLPRQIATFDLPISFGGIMNLDKNDSAVRI